MNTPANHSPGPWHVEKSGGRYEIWPKDNGQTHTYVGIAQRAEDAWLFAAARELLDAARLAAVRLESGTEQEIAFNSRIAAELRRAIAKADGK
jgi:hypothetical protein